MNELDKNPYKPLGKRLKELRTSVNESLAEASGAVEIDVMELAGYELGKSRPSEDVLLLLISHFGAKDDEAVGIWEMAGYGLDKIPTTHEINNDILTPRNSSDDRILFTDVVDIVVNNYGVIMNFMQTGPANTSQSVARVGMSREHAKSILKILQTTISQTEQAAQKTQQADNGSAKN